MFVLATTTNETTKENLGNYYFKQDNIKIDITLESLIVETSGENI